MKRIVKDPETRRKEILGAAGELISENGYTNTTVESIIRKVGVAKGTFYYYFKSKEDILDALVQSMVENVCAEYRKVSEDTTLNALEKMKMMLRGEKEFSEMEIELMENMHKPDNREFHERINVEIIRQVSPVFAEVIEQGNSEGIFKVEKSLETIQFLLAGSQFLMESDLFSWSREERLNRDIAMQSIIERSLGARPGDFSFI